MQSVEVLRRDLSVIVLLPHLAPKSSDKTDTNVASHARNKLPGPSQRLAVCCTRFPLVTQ